MGDYCSFPQENKEKGILRSPEQTELFKKGLAEVNTIYGHTRTTVLRCTGLPQEVARRYEDRGWTLFEECISDTKPKPAHKVFVFDDSFDPKTKESAFHFFLSAIKGQKPPCSAKRFVELLNIRKDRAEKRGLNLFTNGKDNPFVVRKYAEMWTELHKVYALNFQSCPWQQTHVQILCDVLPEFSQLRALDLRQTSLGCAGSAAVMKTLTEMKAQLIHLVLIQCQMSSEGAKALAACLQEMPSLTNLNVGFNHLMDEGMLAIIQSLPIGVRGFSAIATGCTDTSLELLASRLQDLPMLSILMIGLNVFGTAGVAALGRAFAGTALERVNLSWGAHLSKRGVDTEALRAAWKAAGKPEEGLVL